jgi:glutaredoxin
MELQVVEVAPLHGHSLSHAVGTILRVRVVLYSRPRCGLCDQARAVIRAELGRSTFDFEEIDVESDDALELEYGIRIPVVLVDGEERFEISVDPAAFAALVRA